jgi:hypothetical protein
LAFPERLPGTIVGWDEWTSHDDKLERDNTGKNAVLLPQIEGGKEVKWWLWLKHFFAGKLEARLVPLVG